MPVYVSFPYYEYINEKVRNELKDIVYRRFPQINFKPVFKNKCMIGSLFKHKETLSTSVCSSLVYNYRCLLCNKQYIGSTVRQLQCRISEYMGVLVCTGLPMTNNPNSAIYKQRYDTGHQTEKDQFKVKRSCHNKYDVRLLEALYIKKEKPELNDGLPVELALLHWGFVPRCGWVLSVGLLFGVSPSFSASICAINYMNISLILLLLIY